MNERTERLRRRGELGGKEEGREEHVGEDEARCRAVRL